jgi:ribosomal protein S18 acetylase RimI-like enzyme
MSDAAQDIQILLVTGGAELLDRVEPLWVQGLQFQADLSDVWRKGLLELTFAERRRQMLRKASQDMLVVLATSEGSDIGYCVSSIDHGIGEVDLFFVDSAHRGHHVGDAIMLHTLDWFKQMAVKSIVVEVLDGNDGALAFFTKYGFRSRLIKLQQINE